MKIVSKDGKTWVEKKQDGKLAVGFTRAMLEELGECWAILPATSNKVEIKEGQPLCSVETNDGVFCVKSPAKGIIAFFAPQAINFPDQLTEDAVVATLKDQADAEEAVPDMFAEPALRELRGAWRQQVVQQEQPIRAIHVQPNVFIGDEPPQPVRAEPVPRGGNLDPAVGPVFLADLERAVAIGRMQLIDAQDAWRRAQDLGQGVR